MKTLAVEQHSAIACVCHDVRGKRVMALAYRGTSGREATKREGLGALVAGMVPSCLFPRHDRYSARLSNG
jgi:hypothetical protein